MEVDVFHGHHLRVAAAGCAALDAEHGAEGGFAEAEHGLFAQSVHGVGQTHAGGGLALARRGGADSSYKDHLALLGRLMDQAVVDLGLVAAIGDHVLVGDAEGCGDLGNGLHFRFLCDLDIRLHGKQPPSNKKGSFAQQLRKAAQTVGIDKTSFLPHCGAPQRSVSGKNLL